MYEPGEIVLAAFPFAGLGGTKRRPCLVLAVGDFDDDFIVAFITTNQTAASLRSAVSIVPEHRLWVQTGLKALSIIRTDKLATLRTTVISGAIGTLPPDVFEEVRRRLRSLLQL
jgi:mRNA interferase MazF